MADPFKKIRPDKKQKTEHSVDEDGDEPEEPKASSFKPTSETKIRDEIRMHAYEESHRYFEERARLVEETFEHKEEAIRGLLHRMADRQPVVVEDIYEALHLDERRAEDRSIVKVIDQGLHKCKPIVEAGSAYDVLKKYVLDLVDPKHNVEQEMRVFDEERDAFFDGDQRDFSCWYFTPKGNMAIRRIESEVRIHYGAYDETMSMFGN